MTKTKKNRLTVGYAANVKSAEHEGDSRYDEWESTEDLEHITKALESVGSQVIFIDAGKNFYHDIERHREEIDIVFNNAESLPEVRNRESMVPAILEFLDIPFTGSDMQTLANSLDKVTTREILANYGINNPPFQRFQDYADRLRKDLRYPLVVKPAMEGTSIGVSQNSVVENGRELYRAVRGILDEYGKDAIAEEFVDGREYTVGIVGNLVLPPLYLDLKEIPGQPKVRDFDVKEIDTNYSRFLSEYDKPYRELVSQAVIAHLAMGCNDYNRMDFRERDGKIYFLEMNPLPGLHPDTSDLPKEARAAGIDYSTLVNMVMYEAINRYKKDPKFEGVFTGPKIEAVRGLVESKREELTAHGQIQDHDIVARIEKFGYDSEGNGVLHYNGSGKFRVNAINYEGISQR